MAADDVGAMERAWICAGFRLIVSADWEEPGVFAPAGLPPLVMVPARWVAEGRRDEAFAVGMARLFLKRYGWLALVRVLVHLDEAAAFFGAMGQEQSAD